jgi:hypothetical protein
MAINRLYQNESKETGKPEFYDNFKGGGRS